MQDKNNFVFLLTSRGGGKIKNILALYILQTLAILEIEML